MEPHTDDEQTLGKIRDIFEMDRKLQQALTDAYHIGRIRGTLEGAGEIIARLESGREEVSLPR